MVAEVKPVTKRLMQKKFKPRIFILIFFWISSASLSVHKAVSTKNNSHIVALSSSPGTPNMPVKGEVSYWRCFPGKPPRPPYNPFLNRFHENLFPWKSDHLLRHATHFKVKWDNSWPDFFWSKVFGNALGFPSYLTVHCFQKPVFEEKIFLFGRSFPSFLLFLLFFHLVIWSSRPSPKIIPPCDPPVTSRYPNTHWCVLCRWSQCFIKVSWYKSGITATRRWRYVLFGQKTNFVDICSIVLRYSLPSVYFYWNWIYLV